MDLEEFGKQSIKEQNNYMQLKKCKNPSKILLYNRIINKKSISSVMNERYLLSNLKHP